MLIVAGLSLRSIEPRVWDKNSEYFLEPLRGVMVSYAEVHQMQSIRREMMHQGIRNYLNVPSNVKVFLDNGAFGLSRKGIEIPNDEYEEFVEESKPDWRPIPRDYIPAPSMSLYLQRKCMELTMDSNTAFEHDGYVPVVHISRVINTYIARIKANDKLVKKPNLAIGGIVPNLLRAPKAIPHLKILKSLIKIRDEFSDKKLHIFGVGGISTLHLTASLGIDSIDSSGWRNRAARGIILLPGKSERTIAQLGSWNGRQMSADDLSELEKCQCPPCLRSGKKALTAKASEGFRNRATHNLWVLLEEERWIGEKMDKGSYFKLYSSRVENSTYRPLIEYVINTRHLG